jgi:hypothetical protein
MAISRQQSGKSHVSDVKEQGRTSDSDPSRREAQK